MSLPPPGTAEVGAGSLFDVVVRVPANVTLEQIEAQALAAGIAPQSVARLIPALRSVPQQKIGAAVTAERAEAAKLQFTRAGLTVEITPVLGLQAISTAEDAAAECPACGRRVVLTPQRQCPSCGVYVDKVDPEEMLKRKVREQERAKLHSQMTRDRRDEERQAREKLEAKIRAKIREELEAEYGISKRRRIPVALGATVAVTLLVAAFVGGRGTGAGWSWAELTGGTKAAQATDGSPDKVLASMGPKPPRGKGGTAAAGAGAPAGTATGDPDIDDPLIRAAGGDRIGAEGLTVEQAVAASMVLARSVGNTTAQSAIAGGPAVADGTAPPANVPANLKTVLALEFTRQLAEMGQWPRARGIIKALRASPRTVPDPALAAAAQLVDVEVQAWSLQGVDAANARAATEALLEEATAIPDPANRSRALAQAGAILSQVAAIPPEVSRMFLTKASEAAKAAATPPERARATSDLSVAIGEALLAQVSASTRTGRFAGAKKADEQLQALAGGAADPRVQAKLLAMAARSQSQLGQEEPAARILARSLGATEKVGTLADRGALLQSVLRLSRPGNAVRIDEAAAALQAQAMGRSGAERAGALVELAVLHALSGAREKDAELGQAAQLTPGLSEEDAISVQTQLLVRRDLALARRLYEVGSYGDAEVVVRRLGAYLL